MQFLNPFGNAVIQAPAILKRWNNVNITRPMLFLSLGPIIIINISARFYIVLVRIDQVVVA